MKILLCLLPLFLFNTYASEPEVLKPFSTDYCTKYPEGTRAQPELWKHCCLEHDLYFWAGGLQADRRVVDLQLRSCVEATGALNHARLIYAAVTVGGSSPVRFKTKQWGNAFVERPRYQALSEAETRLLIEHLELNNSELSTSLMQSFKDQLNSRLDVQ